MDEARFRLRVRFRKVGRLCYLSHLELIHALERTIRRARLPFRITQGFSPRMKVAFGPALGCGTAGKGEYLDIWLSEYVPVDEALSRLQQASPDDLMVEDCRYVAESAPSLVVALTVSRYMSVLEREDGADFDLATVADVVSAVKILEQEGCVEVTRKNKTKQVMLRDVVIAPLSFMQHDEAHEAASSRMTVSFTLRSRESGSLRPELYVDAVLGRCSKPLMMRSCVREALLVEERGRLISLEEADDRGA